MVKMPKEILEFWFSEGVSPFWFRRNDDLDKSITDGFLDTFVAADADQLGHWLDDAMGTLAFIITLDQFPRNMFRGSPRSFQTDDKALEAAKFALAQGFDKLIEDKQRQFLYLPFMHSEDLADQQICVSIYEKLGNENALDFAKQHHDIITKFGRFPHRNRVLNRQSTVAEIEFLKLHAGF